VGLLEVGDVRRSTSEQLAWYVLHGRGMKNGMKPLQCVRLQRASGKQFVAVTIVDVVVVVVAAAAAAAAADDDDNDEENDDADLGCW